MVKKLYPLDLLHFSHRVAKDLYRQSEHDFWVSDIQHFFPYSTDEFYVYKKLPNPQESTGLVLDQLYTDEQLAKLNDFNIKLSKKCLNLSEPSKKFFFVNQSESLALTYLNGEEAIEHSFNDDENVYVYLKSKSKTTVLSPYDSSHELKPNLGVIKSVAPLKGLFLAVVADCQIHLIRKSDGSVVKTLNSTIDVDAIGVSKDKTKLLWQGGMISKKFHVMDFSTPQTNWNAKFKGILKRRFLGLHQGAQSPYTKICKKGLRYHFYALCVLKVTGVIKLSRNNEPEMISKLLLINSAICMIIIISVAIFRFIKPRA